MLKRILVAIGLLSCLSTAAVQPKVHSFPASVKALDLVNAELSAATDKQGISHLVWVKNSVQGKSLEYTRFNPMTETFEHRTIRPVTGVESPFAPEVAVDAAGGVHVVFFLLRGGSKTTYNGNFAVMYGSAPSPTGAFQFEQVSTNVNDTTKDVKDSTACYINDRPSLTLLNGLPVVTYFAKRQSNGIQVVARRAGSGWDRKLSIWMENTAGSAYPKIGGSFSASNGVEVDSTAALGLVMGVPLSSASPVIVHITGNSWTVLTTSTATNTDYRKNLQLLHGPAGTLYAGWVDSDSGFFCVSQILPTGNTPIRKIQPPTRMTNNLFPIAMDSVTGKLAVYYSEPYGPNHLGIETESGFQFFTLQKSGVAYGRHTISFQNGALALATMSQGDSAGYLITLAEGVAIKPNLRPSAWVKWVQTGATLRLEPMGSSEALQIQVVELDGRLRERIHAGVNGSLAVGLRPGGQLVRVVSPGHVDSRLVVAVSK